MRKKAKIVFTGGGSGGHIFPIIAIVRQMKKIRRDFNLKLYYIGSGDRYSLNLLRAEGVRIKRILTGKLRRYFSLKNLVDIFKIPVGLLQSFCYLFFLAPDIVFSKAGHGSFGPGLSAKILGIPLFLHESDAVPGLAAQMQSKWATEIFVSFLDKKIFPAEKIISVGNPIRQEILNGSREQAGKIFNLESDKPILFIWAGSQGSQKINQLIMSIVSDLLENFELIHQTGHKNFKYMQIQIQAFIKKQELRKRYHVFPFLNEDQLKHALAGADLIVSRAGAGAIFEIAAAGKPAILIPLLSASRNHQLRNAYSFERRGGGEVIEEKNLTEHFFLEKLKYLFERPDILQKMSAGSKSFAKPRAAKIIASYLLEYLSAMKK